MQDASHAGQADLPDWQNEILALEEQARQAFQSQDVERLRELWSDQLLVNSPLNRVNGKEDLLQLVARGIIRHAALESRTEAISRLDGIVVVMGSESVTDKPDTAPYQRRFTNVWRMEGNAWRLIARHANIIAPAG